MIKVFLDANVIFSASYSPTGGSSLIIRLGEQRKIMLFSSRLALKEAERNLREKAKDEDLDRFYQIFEKVNISLVDVSREKVRKKFGYLVGGKDSPILASALQSKAGFLLTLDRKHFLKAKLKKANLPIIIITPGEFIQKYL